MVIAGTLSVEANRASPNHDVIFLLFLFEVYLRLGRPGVSVGQTSFSRRRNAVLFME